jgi:selenocysteine-specific elongation factor
LQLVLEKPLVAERHDRFILRRPSPAATLGGGQVAEAHPARMYRRRDPRAIDRLEALTGGTASEALAQALSLGPTALRLAVRQANLEPSSAQGAIAELIEQGRVIALSEAELTANSDALAIESRAWNAMVAKLRSAVERYHATYPLRSGIPREELKSRIGLDVRTFAAVLSRVAHDGLLRDLGARVALPDFKVRLSQAQQGKVAELMRLFETDRASTPSMKQTSEVLGDELLGHLIESGQLVQVSADVLFESGAYQSMVTRVRERLAAGGKLTVAEVRDMFGTSRKYALGLMEHLDAIGVTVREGDERRLA